MITRPMPSMPVGCGATRTAPLYRSSYFDMFPGVWRQGDWIRFTERGSCVVTGRSDATLNRGGVRLGTGEFYSVVEELPEVTDSLVVHLEDEEGGPGSWCCSSCSPTALELDDELRAQHRPAACARSSRRVTCPTRSVAVPAIPRTLTGQEARGARQAHPPRRAVEAVASRDSLLDPTALDLFAALAAGERPAGHGAQAPDVGRV